MKEETANYRINIDEAALARLRQLIEPNMHVKIGILSNAEPHEGIGTAKLAMIHEFGAPRAGIPERSFLRRTMHVKAGAFRDFVRSNHAAIFQTVFKSGWSPVFKKFGAQWVAYVLQCFQARGFSPKWRKLADSTIARRKNHSDIPLQDTRAMMRSITFEVKRGA